MPIYKQTTEITNIDDLLSSVERDIEEVYFGDKNVFTVWGEYDGTLPAQYSANGDYLADYRIYGSAGGVGDRTEQLFDAETAVYKNGVYKNDNGVEAAYQYAGYYETYIPITPSETIYVENVYGTTNLTVRLYFYDAQKQWIQRTDGYVRGFSVVAPSNAAYAQLQISPDFISSPNTIMITQGSTAPASYVTYGYEVNMSVSDGTTSTTTQIYIGSSPLNAYEYIDYASGKIYRWSNNQLSVPEVREKTNEEVTCTVSNDGVYTLTVSNTVQRDRNLSFSYNPVEIPDGKTWVVAAFAENILDDNGMITLGDAIHPVASAYIRNNGYNVNRAADPSATTYILDRMAITVRAGTPAGTFTLRPMLMYIEPTDPPVPLPALPTCNGTNIVDYTGQSAAVPSRFYAKYRKEGF